MNPYREALAWISQSPDTASAMGLAKLILSVSNSQWPFSLGDCLSSVTGPQVRLAMRVASHYAEHGGGEELEAVSKEVCGLFPRFVVLGQVMTEAGRHQARIWWLESRNVDALRERGKQPDDE